MRAFFLMIVAYVLVFTLTPFVVFVNGFRKKNKTSYFERVAIGLDQAGGSVLYGTEDWTVSSWTYYLCSKRKKYCWFMGLIDLLFGKEHCKNSYLKEKKELRNGGN